MSVRHDIPEHELYFIYEALKCFECELEVIEREFPWFMADSRDRLQSSLEILETILEIEDDEYDEESEQETPEFYDDGEGVFDYLDSLGDDE